MAWLMLWRGSTQREHENRSIAEERGGLDRKGETGAQGRVGHFEGGGEDWESEPALVPRKDEGAFQSKQGWKLEGGRG